MRSHNLPTYVSQNATRGVKSYASAMAALEVDDFLAAAIAIGAEHLHGEDGCVLCAVDGDAGNRHAGGT